MMDILQAIKERRSVRTFDGKPLSENETEVLNKAIQDSFSPFGGHVDIRLKEFDLKGEFKPSTYGTIKGASDYFLIGMLHDEASALSAGFRFEQVVLKAWQMELGTCWIAATFKGTDFDRDETWPDGETLTIVSPVGRPVKQSLGEKMTRIALGSKNRKPMQEMFWTDNFASPVEEGNPYWEALSMMRLAPSAKNAQPWRALVADDKTVHFYYRTKSETGPLDLGIGLYHFYAALRAEGRDGQFGKLEAPAHEEWTYATSWKAE